MNIINLTPHAIKIVIDDPPGERVIPSTGVARVSATIQTVGDIDGIPVVESEYGEVTGLPEPVPGRIFIVSAMVRQAANLRKDLYSPANLIRNEKGEIVGCKALEGNPL